VGRVSEGLGGEDGDIAGPSAACRGVRGGCLWETPGRVPQLFLLLASAVPS
jgi:hypothetical protein